jgi:hypothetical protein
MRIDFSSTRSFLGTVGAYSRPGLVPVCELVDARTFRSGVALLSYRVAR